MLMATLEKEQPLLCVASSAALRLRERMAMMVQVQNVLSDQQVLASLHYILYGTRDGQRICLLGFEWSEREWIKES